MPSKFAFFSAFIAALSAVTAAPVVDGNLGMVERSDSVPDSVLDELDNLGLLSSILPPLPTVSVGLSLPVTTVTLGLPPSLPSTILPPLPTLI
ncbi:hypothetical protein F5I97DRAFT_1930422 [Phlebopus sp. FC_14]|nr:hypothetical protein F5I97DRAFT_1930422 [Phlebopus sp. FC_14]